MGTSVASKKNKRIKQRGMTSKAFLEPSWRYDNQTAAGLLASPFSERLPTSSSAKRGSSGSWPRESSQRHVVVVHKKRHTAAGLHGILTRFPFHTSASTPMGGHLRDRVSPAKVIMKKNKAKGFDGFLAIGQALLDQFRNTKLGVRSHTSRLSSQQPQAALKQGAAGSPETRKPLASVESRSQSDR